MGCISSKIIRTESKNSILLSDKVNILYIEDSDIHVQLLTHILKKHCQRCVLIHRPTVINGYKYLKFNKVDFLIIDRYLNNESGDDLIDLIEQEKSFDLNNIIIISEISEPNDIQKYTDMGIKYFIKPLDIEEFIRYIKMMKNKKLK